MNKPFANIIIAIMRTALFKWLKKWLYQWLIKKIIGTAIGGVYGWIAGFAYDIAWKKAIKPVAKKVATEIVMVYRRINNKKKIEDLQNAKTEDDFDSSVDRLP